MLPRSFVYDVLVLSVFLYLCFVVYSRAPLFSPSLQCCPVRRQGSIERTNYSRLCNHSLIQENSHTIPHSQKNREDGVLCQQTISGEIQKIHLLTIRILHRSPKWQKILNGSKINTFRGISRQKKTTWNSSAQPFLRHLRKNFPFAVRKSAQDTPSSPQNPAHLRLCDTPIGQSPDPCRLGCAFGDNAYSKKSIP